MSFTPPVASVQQLGSGHNWSSIRDLSTQYQESVEQLRSLLSTVSMSPTMDPNVWARSVNTYSHRLNSVDTIFNRDILPHIQFRTDDTVVPHDIQNYLNCFTITRELINRVNTIITEIKTNVK